MVNDLQQLMRENVASPPPEHLDLDGLVVAGRGRVRQRRRRRVAGGGALLSVAGLVTAAVVAWPAGTPGGEDRFADRPPAPDAPTVSLADAVPAVEGQDYRVLSSYTNSNLNRDNGQYYDGVTDDGKVLFRDGPRMGSRNAAYALLDPATGAEEPLPDPGLGQQQAWPIELSAERVVLATGEYGDDPEQTRLVAHVYDRTAGTWTTRTWPDLPDTDFPGSALVHDGRVYVRSLVRAGAVPEGGWPTQAGGDAEDADAEGDTYRLWSASLTDPSDVRDEGVTLGAVAFTDTAMVWTEGTQGDPGRVHVRDLATGEETSFDPRTGERCNLLGFGATGDRIVMSEYCGTYGDVRDDRVQVLSTTGEQIVTVQDSDLEGGLAGDLVQVRAYRDGTYVYDLATDRFVQVTDAVSNFGLGGPVPDGLLLWDTPVNKRNGATQTLAEWLG